jgi:hypothetical protein
MRDQGVCPAVQVVEFVEQGQGELVQPAVLVG